MALSQIYEYIIVYLTAQGRRAGIYKGMDHQELDRVVNSLKQEGCTVEKVEIVRSRIGV